MLQTLQAARGIAALMVVLYHLNGSIWGNEKYFKAQFFTPFGFGNAGVYFFFVLSGFIILHAHRRDFGSPAALPSYAAKRFNRIYPIYWIVMAAIVPVYFLAPQMGRGFEVGLIDIITSVLLLPYPHEPILAVSWTLRHEVLFYALFALSVANLRFGMIAFALWFSACVAALAVPVQTFPFNFWTSPLNMLFGAGMAVSYLAWRGVIRHGWPFAIVGMAIFLATGLYQVQNAEQTGSPIYVFLFGAASALTIAGLVAVETAKPIIVPALLRHLGDASYSIYLVHFPALSVLAKIAVASGMRNHLPEPAIFVLLFVGAVAAGSVTHLMVEAPLLERLNRKRPALRTE